MRVLQLFSIAMIVAGLIMFLIGMHINHINKQTPIICKLPRAEVQYKLFNYKVEGSMVVDFNSGILFPVMRCHETRGVEGE